MGDIVAHELGMTKDMIEKGLKKEKISAASLIESSANKYMEQIRNSGITVFFNSSPDFVEVDVKRFSAVLHLLLGNAIEAEAKEITVKSERTRGNAIRFEVIDNGPGIPGEIQDKIFIPRFTTKTGEGQNGTGLGLPTARSIAKMHGGNVWLISSEPGKTIFAAEVPAAETPAEINN